MFNEVITLVKTDETENEAGELEITAIIQKDVLVEVQSVGQKEFFQAQANGFKPDIVFKLADFYDYSGENLIEYEPKTGEKQQYKVYRTSSQAENNDILLFCTRLVNGVDVYNGAST